MLLAKNGARKRTVSPTTLGLDGNESAVQHLLVFGIASGTESQSRQSYEKFAMGGMSR
jgi:hypothetical protein